MRATAMLIAACVLASCGGKKTTKRDDVSESVAAFAAMGEVLTHPRCINCHPSGDSPTQGDEMIAHQPPVFRGDEGHGAIGMRCDTCHLESNVPLTEGAPAIPGVKDWHLAPRSMGWQGKSLGEICAQLKDPARNGGKTLEEVHQHMANDGLVGWAWDPGEGRSPAPGTRAAFTQSSRRWIETGAHCPNDT